MYHQRDTRPLSGIILALSTVALLAGCAGGQTSVAVHAPGVRAVVAAPSPPVVVAVPPPVYVQTYVPGPYDPYIAVAVDTDVVLVGGDTYIWVVGPGGRRERHFFGHGDLRQEVFRRREALRVVMHQHGGHLPSRAEIARDHAVRADPHPGAGAPHSVPHRPTQAVEHPRSPGEDHEKPRT